ncbi:hypothetical protein [Dokdonia pacifica]|uniref:DUF4177 domain-containing protein n=1 Tax=Dokdonia pacifica TaxID=1627892 RepID=A0A238WB04_9FLAO|nr:hypothetical protein [Dokdonia pacifica]GGG14109.1 hypothetical protein GCM10011344_13430 [Dokdonia pacifica]SNR42879.1 hypothetical protein SAMN06265376_101806 [Dokdonia pacifica]
MEYKVVPLFRSASPDKELQTIINQNVIDGWEYKNHQYSDKLTPGKEGCFGIGATPDTVTHVGLVVFEKK